MRSAIAAVGLMLLGAPAIADCEMPPSGQPLALSRPVGGSIAREYGETWDDLKGMKTFHAGLDFEAPEGEPVYAALSGRVIKAARDGALGNTVVVEHGAGVETVYGHLARTSVSEGTCVKAGQEIGTVGSTGQVPGPRLYLELRRAGKAVDPTGLLQ